eukprot:2169010-Lingulodinium_polyedra.AAC.1
MPQSNPESMVQHGYPKAENSNERHETQVWSLAAEVIFRGTDAGLAVLADDGGWRSPRDLGAQAHAQWRGMGSWCGGPLEPAGY